MYTNRNQIWRISEQKLEIPDFGISTVRNPHSATSSKTKVLETFLQPETLRKLFLEQWNAAESALRGPATLFPTPSLRSDAAGPRSGRAHQYKRAVSMGTAVFVTIIFQHNLLANTRGTGGRGLL